MGYEENLWNLLRPLGVYREDGYSGGEIYALGKALDGAAAYLDKCMRETQVMTAQGSGLTLAEELFPRKPKTETDPERDAAQRREDLQKLWQTDCYCFSGRAIKRTMAGCGIEMMAGSNQPFFALVSLPLVLTIYDEPVFLFWLLEQMLPSHVDALVTYSYRDQETGEPGVYRNGLTNLRQMTQEQWEELLGDYKEKEPWTQPTAPSEWELITD